MTQAISITSPPGRLVDGNLYTPQTTDADGNPLVIKTGPNAGQPRVNYYFAVAIPKAGEQHWSQTVWGQQIWGVGHQAFPQAAQSPTFAWKVEDGDSQIPNKRGRKNADREGYPGNWIIKLSSGYAPRIYKQEAGGYVQVMDKDFLKPGYYVEVAFTVDGNGSQQQPGVYVNHSMVLFRAYGQEIVFGPDPASAGFGSAPLPPGASLTPPASAMPPPASAIPPPAQAQASIPVLPSPSFVQVPPPVPTIPGAAAAAPGYPIHPSSVSASVPYVPTISHFRTMTPKANGLTYEAYIGSGWTDELLIQHGLMLA